MYIIYLIFRGNITAGLDLIRKNTLLEANSTNSSISKESKSGKVESDPLEDEEKAFAITIPLLTTSTGEKFGKSEGNAIWLDSSLLSVFDFYQVFL